MRLVHGHEEQPPRRVQRCEHLLEALGSRAPLRDEDERVGARRDGPLVVCVERVQRGRPRRVAYGGGGGVELTHLVVHQRDQRRDHEHNLFCVHGGQLEEERLATVRWPNYQGVPSAQEGAKDVALTASEARVAELAAQRGLERPRRWWYRG